MTDFKKSTVREYFETIVIAVTLALFVRTWVVQAFKIPTGSMENNLLIGDHLLVNKFVFAPAPAALEKAILPVDVVERRDIVVFKYPDQPDRDFIKRVIGLPGETIELRNKKVYVNGNPLDEPYVHFLEAAHGSSEVTSFDVRERYGPVTVPAGQFWARALAERTVAAMANANDLPLVGKRRIFKPFIWLSIRGCILINRPRRFYTNGTAPESVSLRIGGGKLSC